MKMGETCELCGGVCSATNGGYDEGMEFHLQKISCPRCGHYYISTTAGNHLRYLDCDGKGHRILLAGFVRRWSLEYPGKPFVLRHHRDIEECLQKVPRSIAAKLEYLLNSLRLMPKFLGHQFDITEGNDFTLGCFTQPEELRFGLRTLEEQGFIDVAPHDRPASTDTIPTCAVTLKAKSYPTDARAAGPLRVFISSTCYDLLDVRFEIADLLEAAGHIVRQSDCEERFDVDGTTDSIELCLQNLENCDLVILIVSRRYGGLLKTHAKAIEKAAERQLSALSATHLELIHAREQGIPVLSYVRDRAEVERGLVRDGDVSKCRWLQLGKDPEQHSAWLKMMDEIHKDGVGGTKWVTQFSTIVDLKKMILHRVNNWKPAERRV